MPRLRKLRRKQKFQYNVNRKRLNKKHNKLPQINCDIVRKAWDQKKSISANLTSMGLIADANSIKINNSSDNINENEEEKTVNSDPTSVANQLESEARENFKIKKSNPHPLPKEMVKKLTKLIDKYGEDYEAMSRDFMNYNQETPTQLKSQISRLKKIPQQWAPYLKTRGLLPDIKAEDNEI